MVSDIILVEPDSELLFSCHINKVLVLQRETQSINNLKKIRGEQIETMISITSCNVDHNKPSSPEGSQIEEPNSGGIR